MNTLETYDRLFTISVDVQNDFCPGGSLAVPEGDLVVSALNRANRWTRAQGGQVIFTRDWHALDLANEVGGDLTVSDPLMAKRLANEHFQQWPVHCVQYTHGAAFHKNLEIFLPEDTIASKGMSLADHGYSGWSAELSKDSKLYRANTGYDRYGDGGVATVAAAVHEATYKPRKSRIAVVIGGLATDYCVKATVLGALNLSDRLARSDWRGRLSAYLFDNGEKKVSSAQSDEDLLELIRDKEAGGAPKFDDRPAERRLGIFVVRDGIRAVNVQPGDGDAAIAEMEAAGATFVNSEHLIAGKVLAVRS